MPAIFAGCQAHSTRVHAVLQTPSTSGCTVRGVYRRILHIANLIADLNPISAFVCGTGGRATFRPICTLLYLLTHFCLPPPPAVSGTSTPCASRSAGAASVSSVSISNSSSLNAFPPRISARMRGLARSSSGAAFPNVFRVQSALRQSTVVSPTTPRTRLRRSG